MEPTADEMRRNLILGALPQPEQRGLAGHLTPVDLKLKTVLYEPGGSIDHVYFPIAGVVSLVADLGGGTVVEVATVGHEGMVGLPVFLGAGPPAERASVQIAGRALRMSAERFRHDVSVLDGRLQLAMQRYTQAMFTQLARNAACNRMHNVRQRCARWLLMTADRMHAGTFDLTQEFLAQMLGVRRASVSEVAAELQAEGCISYSRGTIVIEDRAALRSRACDCYAVVRDAVRRAYEGL
ncbi:Crp/Fnr family transcriptional regulator [[Actinomadura] parvosata]|uniref:Crp/Fnr family transcriptional regulator n=1 Tax=[Actinomadura] parvosata TaxID=1955412 RepID=UPI00406C6717